MSRDLKEFAKGSKSLQFLLLGTTEAEKKLFYAGAELQKQLMTQGKVYDTEVNRFTKTEGIRGTHLEFNEAAILRRILTDRIEYLKMVVSLNTETKAITELRATVNIYEKVLGDKYGEVQSEARDRDFTQKPS